MILLLYKDQNTGMDGCIIAHHMYVLYNLKDSITNNYERVKDRTKLSVARNVAKMLLSYLGFIGYGYHTYIVGSLVGVRVPENFLFRPFLEREREKKVFNVILQSIYHTVYTYIHIMLNLLNYYLLLNYSLEQFHMLLFHHGFYNI